MKKVFFICCIAVSGFALSTSAHTGNYSYTSIKAGSDTTPPMMSDSMHHGAMKMHKKGHMAMSKDSTSGMSMSTDSTSTTPPKN